MGSVTAHLAACLALLTGFAPQEPGPPAQARGFRYEPGRLPLGRVLRYRKSNRDGSQPSEVALYLAGESALEALKWVAGEPDATLVAAEMDWEVCSVKSFHTWRIEAGERRSAAVLETSADRRRLTVRVDGREQDGGNEHGQRGEPGVHGAPPVGRGS